MKARGVVVIVGTGAMGGALARAWARTGVVPPSRLRLLDADAAKARRLARETGARAAASVEEALQGARLLVLAVKPGQMADLLASLAPRVSRGCLVVSVAAGVPLSALEHVLPPGTPVVRVMPNTPALAGEGMAGVARGRRARRAHLREVLRLFTAVGRAVEVPESRMDLVTGVSGSGPAYAFLLMEALEHAARAGGLPAKTARLLAVQTVLGAGRLARESGRSPAELRVQVTSPGGTTEAALELLRKRGVRRAMEAAVRAAARRGAEISRAFRKMELP